MDRKPLAWPHCGYARFHETDAHPSGESRVISEGEPRPDFWVSFRIQGGDSPLTVAIQRRRSELWVLAGQWASLWCHSLPDSPQSLLILAISMAYVDQKGSLR